MKESFGSEPPSKGWKSAGNGRWVLERPEIAIVGGGPGGLLCAYLLNRKMPDASLTIFESSNRLGGKIRTDEFSDGTPFEAGVSELYGGKDDPLRMMIEDELGLITVDTFGKTVQVSLPPGHLNESPEYQAESEDSDDRQHYHIVGGIGKLAERLSEEIDADVRLGTRVRKIAKTESDRYEVTHAATTDFDAVLLAMPSHWIGNIERDDDKVIESNLTHYLRVTLLYSEAWWRLAGGKDYFVMDGMQVHDESKRWRSRRGHAVSFLLSGDLAMLLVSQNQSDAEIVQYVLDALTVRPSQEAIEAQVDRYIGGGSIDKIPDLFVCCNDDSLNGLLAAAMRETDRIAEHFGVTK